MKATRGGRKKAPIVSKISTTSEDIWLVNCLNIFLFLVCYWTSFCARTNRIFSNFREPQLLKIRMDVRRVHKHRAWHNKIWLLDNTFQPCQGTTKKTQTQLHLKSNSTSSQFVTNFSTGHKNKSRGLSHEKDRSTEKWATSQKTETRRNWIFAHLPRSCLWYSYPIFNSRKFAKTHTTNSASKIPWLTHKLTQKTYNNGFTSTIPTYPL